MKKIVVVVVLGLACAACASWQARAKFAVSQCSQPIYQKAAAELSGLVASIVTTSPTNAAAQAALQGLADLKEVGLPAVSCALKAFLDGPPAATPEAAKAMSAMAEPRDRAKQFLSAHAE